MNMMVFFFKTTDTNNSSNWITNHVLNLEKKFSRVAEIPLKRLKCKYIVLWHVYQILLKLGLR